MNSGLLKARLDEAGFSAVKVECFPEIGSTNDRAKEIFSETTPAEWETAPPIAALVTAERQSAGRGRHARPFFSPPGSGLYCSLLLHPTALPMEFAPRLTGYVAVALCRALDRTLPEAAAALQIKWVNDLYLCGRKCCGILTEGAIDPERGDLRYAVVGIGLNLSTVFPPELREIATSFAAEGFLPPTPEELLPALLGELQNFEAALSEPDPAYLALYRQRLCFRGEAVTVSDNGIPLLQGKLLGLDSTGALLLETETGICTVPAGDLSLRRREQ